MLGGLAANFQVQENIQPFRDMLDALPATWTVKKSKIDFPQICQVMNQQGSVCGRKHGWLRMGPESEYLKPHVIHKLVLLVGRILEVDSAAWACCGKEFFEALFPDVRGSVRATPKHWRWRYHYYKYHAAMAPEVAVAMHSCWSCLAGYAISPKYSGKSQAFCDAVVSFIEAACDCEEATQDANRTAFEGARRRLAEHRRGVQPTPLMIFRELARTGSLDAGGAASPARLAAAVRAPATAVVGSDEVAATHPQKLRRKSTSTSSMSLGQGCEPLAPVTAGKDLQSGTDSGRKRNRFSL